MRLRRVFAVFAAAGMLAAVPAATAIPATAVPAAAAHAPDMMYN
jgi:hypothetical protein